MTASRAYCRPARRLRLACLTAAALTMLLGGPPPALADWVRNGSASLSGGRIVVTPASGNQAGSAWLNSRIDLAYDVDITLEVFLGNSDSGADGLSVAFHNHPDGPFAVGDTSGGGEWIGMHTIRPALAVEIDTYRNAAWGDPDEDHIAINEFRDATDGPGHTGAAAVSLGNVENGAGHLLRLTWNSAANELTVYFDGIARITYTNDMAADIFGGASQVWFGVAGSTGGAYNLQEFQPLMVNNGLGITKTVMPAAVDPGDPVTYTITIVNSGGIPATLSAISDHLPDGFAYQAGTSNGLTTSDPAVSGQTLTWSGDWRVGPGQTRTLAFQAGSSAAPGTYTNSAIVSGIDFADLSTGPSAPVLVGSDLSTSTKSVMDLDGGDALPGDILRFAISLNETAGRTADGVSVTDEVPANVTGFSVISIPPGALDASTGAGTGANGTGRLQINGISVPANGSAEIVFEVAIAPAAVPGTAIDNTALIVNPNGLGASPTALSVVVADMPGPAAGNKPLYLYDDFTLSRTPPPPQSQRTIYGGDSAAWQLTPPLAAPLTITNAVAIELWIRGGSNRSFTLELASSTAGVIGSLGPFSPPNNYGANPSSFSIPIAGDLTLPAGSTLHLTIANTSRWPWRTIDVHPFRDSIHSRLILDALTVVHVDPAVFFSAAHPGGSPIASTAPGRPVFIRATVSDPFGSFDIDHVTLQWIDPMGGMVVDGAAMDPVVDVNTAARIYEYAAVVPPSGPEGIWTARITAHEGTEGQVRHTGLGTLAVVAPDIRLSKSVSAVFDPVNGTNLPMAIPGALMAYTITAANHGGGAADEDSVMVVDPVPANTVLFVGDTGAPGSGPVAFIDGGTPSGLTFTFGGLGNGLDDLEFSNNGGGNWTYAPVADGNGTDPAVTHVRINPKGRFNGAVGGSIPSFLLRLRVRVR